MSLYHNKGNTKTLANATTRANTITQANTITWSDTITCIITRTDRHILGSGLDEEDNLAKLPGAAIMWFSGVHHPAHVED